MSLDIEVDLLNVHLEDLRREGSNEVLCELCVVLLEAAWKLRGVAEAVEETAKDLVCPLLRLPPLRPLALLLILGNSILRDLKVNDLEEETAPRHETVRALLVGAQMKDDTCGVCFQNKVEKGGHFLVGTSWRV